ncbi:hemoglobin [Filimonas zeae]|uniref:Hemoglobin n=1 Tax=Filimonas zeae TaxID=1737353 RepID=A0A917IPK7_9BACT|nr:group III truncated hemoglobin [Filimonas zeae]MDR6337462.1 hemoglobin [Filimonas zeae]GGH58738.1 hypothetical protein GCM10011379_04750 [Filimonas zeae]
MKKDIENRQDIQLLVDNFYTKVKADATIGYFFSEVVPVNWQSHLPRMYSFWETVLLGQASYKGNPLLKHIDINRLQPLLDKHFDQWLVLWHQTINELFDGPIAESAKRKPEQMKIIMLSKMHPLPSSLL